MRKTICSKLGFSSPRTASRPPTGCSIRSKPIRERCFCSRKWIGRGTNWQSACAAGRRRRPISSFISLTTMGSRLRAPCTTPEMFPRSGTGQGTDPDVSSGRNGPKADHQLPNATPSPSSIPTYPAARLPSRRRTSPLSASGWCSVVHCLETHGFSASADDNPTIRVRHGFGPQHRHPSKLLESFCFPGPQVGLLIRRSLVRAQVGEPKTQKANPAGLAFLYSKSYLISRPAQHSCSDPCSYPP